MQNADPVLVLDRGDVQVVGPNGRRLSLCSDGFYCSKCDYRCPVGAVRRLIERSIESLKILRSAL